MEASSCNHCYSRKAVCIIYSKGVFVALSIQHAKNMTRFLLCFVVCPAVQNFSTLIIYGRIFEKKKNIYIYIYIENKMYVLIFTTICVWNIPHSKKNWERYDDICMSVGLLHVKNWERYDDMCMSVGLLHVKNCYLLFWPEFNETFIFSTDFRKIIKYHILWKSVLWKPSRSLRTDGRKGGHDKANSRFS